MTKKLANFTRGVVLFTFALTWSVASAEENVSIEDLAVPSSLGQVERRFAGKGDRWVLHIQDIHAHFAAQENIAAIVEHLSTLYGVNTVALEGGWNETTLPESWGLPSSTAKQLAARALLEKDHLTGPGYAAIFNPQPMRLVGIEDRELYKKNRATFLIYLNQRRKTLKLLEAWGMALSEEKRAVLNPKLLALDNALEDYRKGKKAEKFIPRLLESSRQEGIDLSGLDQIAQFLKVMEIQKSIDKNRLQSEATRLVARFKNTGLSFEELLRSGKISAEQLQNYPMTLHYVALIEQQDQIHYRSFFNQIESAIAELKEKLFTSEEERELERRLERYRVAQNLLVLQATPEHWKAFQEEKPAFEAETGKAGLEGALKIAAEFYEDAALRDEIFFQKINEDPRLAGNIIVVAGGFHTEGLTEKFEEAGISHMVITPDLNKESSNEALYFERMQQELPARQAIAAELIYLAPGFDRAFPAFVHALEAPPVDVSDRGRAMQAYRQELGLDSRTSPVLTGGGQLPEGGTVLDAVGLGAQQGLDRYAGWVRETAQAKNPILYVTEASDLIAWLAKSETNRLSLANALDNRATRFAIVGKKPLPIDVIGGKGTLFPESGFETVEAYIESPRFIRQVRAVNNAVVIIGGDKLTNIPFLRIPTESVGFLPPATLLAQTMDVRKIPLAQLEVLMSEVRAWLQQATNLAAFFRSA